MSDRLREALDRYDAVLPASSRTDALNVVLAAARRFLALTETGQRVELCVDHLSKRAVDWMGKDMRVCIARANDEHDVPGPCMFRERLVIPADYLTEEGP